MGMIGAPLDLPVRLLAALAIACVMAAAEPYSLTSPDERIQVQIAVPEDSDGGMPTWSLAFRGKPLLTECELGLATLNGDLMARARLDRVDRSTSNEPIPVLFGRSAQAANRFNEARFHIETAAASRVVVAFRCYDDAVALRYELSSGEAGDPVTIIDERTSFGVAGNPTAFVQYLENFRTSHEHVVEQEKIGNIRPAALLDLPLTLAWEDGTCAAISEAALRRYAGMSLMRRSGENRLICQLTPRPDGTKVVRPLPMRTPWRVVLLGDRPGALLESTTIYALNDPPAFEDVSWIQPGKLTWPWWNGDVYDGQRGEPILSVDMAKRYIDFCARHGIPFHSMTSTEDTVTPWYHQSNPGVEPGPDTDVTRPRAGFDLAEIRRYADSRGVRLWTWAHHGALRGRVEEAFVAFARMGWRGIMVDFLDHDDQETVEFAESVLEAAARHRILVHFHGVWKPTGLERTYPNLMNHEGALNLEYLKWGDPCTPAHNLLMAYTRLIAGPMDYHLGGFRAVPASRFTPRNVAPHVLGTRAHMLAMYVCFDNPAPMIADYPAAYEGQPGFDFLCRVPTWWDETVVAYGEIGEVLVTARRKGATWYIGGMTGASSRDLILPLVFLGRQTHTGSIWRDGPDTETNPDQLVKEPLRVSGADELQVRLAAGGGFVVELTPRMD
jgi:alpha-glucosidase